MATARHHIYAILEEVKAFSDDQLLSEDYLLYLLNRKRDYLLHQKYSDYRRTIPENIRQTIEIGMQRFQRVPGLDGDTIIASTLPIPALSNIDRLINATILSGRDFLDSQMNFVPYERFLHVGDDRWLKNQIYAAFRNSRLILKSGNFRDRGITILSMSGIFADPQKAYEMSPSFDITVPFEDIEYPLTDTLADTAIRMIIKDLSESLQIKEDERNNASPD